MKDNKYNPMSWSKITQPQESNQHLAGALLAGTIMAGASLVGTGISAITGGSNARKQREQEAEMQKQQMQMQQQAALNKIPPGSEGVVPGVANPYMLALGGLSQVDSDNEIRLTEYDGGGTHGQNPLGGIPIGADQQGTPNTVEADETSYNFEPSEDFEGGKYVFSNRLFIDEGNIKSTLGLPNAVRGMSIADASKYIAKMFKGRDDISSKNTEKAFMFRLKDVNEMQKQQMQEQQQLQEAQQQFVYGGMQNQYQLGGVEGENPLAFLSSAEMSSPTSGIDIGASSGDVDISTKVSGLEAQSYTDPVTGEFISSGEDESSSGFFKKHGMNILGSAGLAASTLAPLLANRAAMKNLQKSKGISAMQLDKNLITPNLVNRQQLERNLANQQASSRHAVSQQGLSQGQLAGAYQGIHSGSANALANILLQSNLADAAEKGRVQQGRAGIAQMNIQQQSRTDEINAQNAAAYSNQMAAYRQAQGANIGAVGKSLFNFMQASKYSKYAGQAAKLAALNQSI